MAANGDLRWERPVPLVGDRTAASERAAEPAGWAFPPDARDSLGRIIAARRDIRRYRPDPVPDVALERVLAAAAHAPSVGHSQPARFVLVDDPAIRERAAVLADRERLRQAAALDPDAGRRLLDLQLEGIREAPLGIVVCCDRRAPAAGVLGRATFPDADVWSCACAIQNMWLAARAEGLGMGWVTLFRPAELAELLGLPDGVVTLGWMCLGWPDERPPEPGLVRAGWSRRLPADRLVVRNRWPEESAPQAPVSHLRAPEPHAVVAARDEADRLLTTPGSLGVLDRAVDRLVALGRAAEPGGSPGVLLLAAADHPVSAHRVSAYDTKVTREVAEAAVAGEALGAALARAHGLRTVVVDAGVQGGPVPGALPARPAGRRGDLVGAAAMEAADVRRLVERGRQIGGQAAAAGPIVALGEIGVGNTTVAAALTCLLLDAPPAEIVGLGAGADSAMTERKVAVVTAALDRIRATARSAGRTGARDALAEAGGPELAVLTGAVLGAAAGRAAVVLDGLAVSVAALLAVQLEPGAAAALIAGQRSRERGHGVVLTALGCEPLLDLRIRAGEGAGAVLAAGLVRAALLARRTTARVAY